MQPADPGITKVLTGWVCYQQVKVIAILLNELKQVTLPMGSGALTRKKVNADSTMTFPNEGVPYDAGKLAANKDVHC